MPIFFQMQPQKTKARLKDEAFQSILNKYL